MTSHLFAIGKFDENLSDCIFPRKPICLIARLQPSQPPRSRKSERRGETVERLIEHVVGVTGDQEAALSAIGLTELIHGLYRAQTPAVRIRRQSFLDELLRDLSVYPYTKETAMLAGKLDGEQQNKGIFGDLLIGATALSLGFSVLTENPRHFQKIPGLSVIQL